MCGARSIVWDVYYLTDKCDLYELHAWPWGSIRALRDSRSAPASMCTSSRYWARVRGSKNGEIYRAQRSMLSPCAGRRSAPRMIRSELDRSAWQHCLFTEMFIS
ncbi:hypothetical protein HYPSUDRAFT_69503 [Hypholoma sublateritium FD-334 SS-4]|uniref:Uncharacterized protein n=1 Tax=Hypholoma sublateritium (strain FD-334 SS-4) TaxID=945553 RepID=A0A0D2M6V9_HYPSF|nr:hypothetical protein HYPSUDRAFT_69503 [Hypholoma sublateritium FD-334 SS-4]